MRQVVYRRELAEHLVLASRRVNDHNLVRLVVALMVSGDDPGDL
ncbi:hypothetical protein EBESD8_61630 [Rhodococcus aetherivorans]|nr:hypothetical protein EBESD8_61630 [Rhodococcus aetherivorans]